MQTDLKTIIGYHTHDLLTRPNSEVDNKNDSSHTFN